MKALITITVAGVLLAGSSVYGHAGAQANAGASGSASTQAGLAGTPGAQASGKGAASASASAQAGQNSASLSNGTAVNATLSQPIDAKKNKPGDTVTARTNEATKSEGKVVIPKGSKLVGHVTEAKARTKGESESAVGFVFDKAILKDGREVPLNVTLQAVGAAQSAASNSLAGDDLSAGGGAAGGTRGRVGGGGALGGVTSTAGASTGASGRERVLVHDDRAALLHRPSFGLQGRGVHRDQDVGVVAGRHDVAWTRTGSGTPRPRGRCRREPGSRPGSPAASRGRCPGPRSHS